MDIALDKVCDIIVRARAIDMKEGDTDPASGSNPIDDANLDTLVANPDDATEEELREVIAGLNEDERHDLIALVYVGRGDLEPEEWVEAVRLAREREDASSSRRRTGSSASPTSATSSTRASPPLAGAAPSEGRAGHESAARLPGSADYIVGMTAMSRTAPLTPAILATSAPLPLADRPGRACPSPSASRYCRPARPRRCRRRRRRRSCRACRPC